MDKSIKISIIGAGSGEFSMGIVRDLCLTPGLWGSTVSFMDINPQRLDAIFNVASRYTTELNAAIHFEKTLDRRASLTGADFVINCAMAGGWDLFSQTAQLCYQNGYPQGVFFEFYYQFKLFLDIIHDIEAVCPHAWYIQSANPVFEGCTLLTRQSKVKIVGLCHGDQGVRTVASVIGLDPDKISAQSYGLNHCIWLKKFFYEGKDAYPVLRDWVEHKSRQYFESPECEISGEMGPKAVDIFSRLGLFPIGDTATPGGDLYFRWYHMDRATELKWKEDPNTWYDRHIQHVSARVAAFTRLSEDPGGRATELYPPVKTSETNVAIIDAIVNDNPGIFQVNIPNRGCIPGIADDVVVEVPGLVSGAGIQGLHMEPLPKPIMFHLYDKIYYMDRYHEAFLSGDRNLLMEFVLSNPWTRSIEQARAVMETVFAHPAYQEMAAYFHAPK